MSTSLTKPVLGDPEGSTNIALPMRSQTLGAGREAFQALLGFSALHVHVRHRRGLANPEDVDFVLDEVLQLVAERGMAITGADGVAVALAEGDEIFCRGSAGEMVPDPGARLNPKS